MITLIYSLLRRDSDHLSTWQGSIGSNLPSCPSTHIEPVISGGLGAVAFIHVYSRVIVGGWELSPLPSTRGFTIKGPLPATYSLSCPRGLADVRCAREEYRVIHTLRSQDTGTHLCKLAL